MLLLLALLMCLIPEYLTELIQKEEEQSVKLSVAKRGFLEDGSCQNVEKLNFKVHKCLNKQVCI